MWYVVQTFTGREEVMIRLCQEIVDKGIIKQSRIMRSEKKIRRKGSFITAQINLFPGYVFVETAQMMVIDLYEQFKAVPELTKLLRIGESIIPLSDEEEQFLFGLVDEDYVIRMSKGILVNDRVVVNEGPLQGYEGYITKIDRRARKAVLEVDFFGRMTQMTVGLEVVGKIGARE